MLSKEQTDFILAHDGADTSQLLLSKNKWQGLDIERLAVIVEARKKIKRKIPSWYLNPSLEYADSLSAEQCSSETTAKYKQRFAERKRVVDMTGGLGVDSYFLSRVAESVVYIERKEPLCDVAESNFSALGADNITVMRGDSLSLLSSLKNVDLIYLDPARRGKNSSRVYSIEECEPNLIAIKDALFAAADTVLVKISPMADISRTVSLLPETEQVHIVCSDNECKEVLLLMRAGQKNTDPLIVTDGFSFRMSEERSSSAEIASEIGEYLFLPSKGLLKAGAFKLISSRFGISKLEVSTHLYTGGAPAGNFPGRTLQVLEYVTISKSNVKYLSSKYAKANIIALNLPFDTNQLRAKLGVADGGDIYLIGCKFGSEKVIIAAKKVS
ncbi:MAG: RsmD family RNA methyltransferase [Bacteroidales bacterium]|nr:RsmD family RNA methyltransferase [Bacteroidales bacterium]